MIGSDAGGRFRQGRASSECFGFAPRELSTGKGGDSIDDDCIRTSSYAAAYSVTINVVDGKHVLAGWEAIRDCWLHGVL